MSVTVSLQTIIIVRNICFHDVSTYQISNAYLQYIIICRCQTDSYIYVYTYISCNHHVDVLHSTQK
jgi:hypothetical protein